MTLRRRVLAYMALATLASCALTVVVAVVLVRHQVASRRLSAMRDQAQVLALAGGAPGALRAGDHVYRVGGGRTEAAAPPGRERWSSRACPPRATATARCTLQDRTLLFAAQRTAGGRIVLIRPAKLAFAEWRPLLWSVVLAGLGGALLAALLSLIVSRRLTRPIAALSQATGRLASGADRRLGAGRRHR